MKKYKKIFEVRQRCSLTPDCVLLKLSPCDGVMPRTLPGQFVNILVSGDEGALLRRPISICNVQEGLLWLFVKNVGKGSRWICSCEEGEHLDLLLPLGNGWSSPEHDNSRVLLAGGGVGVAPLLYLGNQLKEQGHRVAFLLGAATASALTLLDEFGSLGPVHLTTDDGSLGVHGNVLAHPVIKDNVSEFDIIYCCGPTPMMKGVAAQAARNQIPCQVSLENRMACGIGACLCCVENTVEGHKCVCTSGPVFNIETLNW